MEILLILIIILVISLFNTNEHFVRDIPILNGNISYLFPNNNIPILNDYTNLPWWNTPVDTRRNMIYDIRGNPYTIPKTSYIWNNPEVFPISNQGI